jgi:ribonuclease D
MYLIQIRDGEQLERCTIIDTARTVRKAKALVRMLRAALGRKAIIQIEGV